LISVPILEQQESLGSTVNHNKLGAFIKDVRFAFRSQEERVVQCG